MAKDELAEPRRQTNDDLGDVLGIHGSVITAADAAYDTARRVYNAVHDRRPLFIVRVADTADVITTVKYAASQGALLAVRGGGHSVAGFGTCDGGIVLDLGGLKRIEIDPERRTARVGAGCTWAEVDRACHVHGLAAAGGVISTTGVAGLTLGGGLGHLSRRCGLSCDNLLSAEVVLSDGRTIVCSEDREPDLFWALRGGGGNFGVVTMFEFRLHPIREVVAGPIFFEPHRDVAHAYREVIAKAPPELGSLLAFTVAPPAPFVPAEWHLKPIVGVVPCFSGRAEDAEAAIAPLRRLGRVVAEHVGTIPYPVVNTFFDELLPPGLRHYWKARFFTELPDEAIDVHLDHSAQTPSVESGGFIYPIDGAVHRVPNDATAFAHRDANFALIIDATWHEKGDDARFVAWARDYYQALGPYADAGGYVNFMTDDDAHRVDANYRGTLARLRALKRRYDPGNLFRVNHNIAPE
jgi:FAD/FMN-containing dehydrogenase